MKYHKLFFILILTGVKAGFSMIFAAEPFHTEFYGDSQGTLGSKVSVPFGEFRTATNQDDTNFGFSFYTKKLFPPLPITVKTGNLSGGGSLSKLANPTLANSSSPFSTGISPVSALTASLPSFTNFSKAQSSFTQLELPITLKNGIKFQNLINIWLTPDAPSPVYSASLSASLAENKLSIDFSVITGSFYYDEANSSSWISDKAYYKSGSHKCSLLQFSTAYKNSSVSTTSASFAAGFYESPFGTVPINLRSDLTFQTSKIQIFTSAFYNPQEDLITSSQKILPSCLQLKSGLISKNMIIPFGSPLFIKSGFNIMGTLNFLTSEQPVITNAGIQFSDSLKTLSFSASLKLTLPASAPSYKPENPDFESLTLQLKNSWNLKHFSPSAAASVTFTEKKDEPAQKYKFSAGLSYGKTHRFSGTAAYSFSSSKNQLSGKKLSASLTARLQFRFVTVSGKLSATLE